MRDESVTLEKDIKLIERKIETLLDRIVETSSDSIIAAYEKRIRDLETEKAVMKDKIANCGKPLKSFGETYRTAFDFLSNPCKLWQSDRIEDRRAVLKLVFADALPYARNEGYRTAQISMPFKLLGGTNMDKKEMVRAAGIEPARDCSLRILSPVRLPVPPCPRKGNAGQDNHITPAKTSCRAATSGLNSNP